MPFLHPMYKLASYEVFVGVQILCNNSRESFGIYLHRPFTKVVDFHGCRKFVVLIVVSKLHAIIGPGEKVKQDLFKKVWKMTS